MEKIGHLMKNQNLRLVIDQKDGLVKSLKGKLSGDKEVEFCDKRALKPSEPCFWGETRIANELKSYYASQGKISVRRNKNKVISSYKFSEFSIEVKREIYRDYLEETYTLSSNSVFNLMDFAIFFRPDLTMHVGEHKAYYFVNRTPVIYHWFTGNNLAYLVISHNNGNPPHLAIVLTRGRICGFTTPYSTRISEPLSSIPILHVTALASHKEEDEYPQPKIYLKSGEKEKVVLRHFLFSDWRDFEQKTIKLAHQPIFRYPHFLPQGQRLEIEAELPEGIPSLKAVLSEKQLEVKKKDKDKYLLTTSVQKPGLQKINIQYGDKKSFILFEGMRNLREIMQKRAKYILDKQFISDPKDRRWGGIFPIDNLTEKVISSPWAENCQMAGTGEMLSSASLVLYKNLISPDPEEIHKIEITATEWMRKKCQDEKFACYLNPLNKLEFKDSKWTYSKSKIDSYVNPHNPKEFGWRRWNAPYNAVVYYLLSLFDSSLLERENRDTYLLWAYGTLNWFFSTEPIYGVGQLYFIPRIIKELEKRGYRTEARKLKKGWDNYVIKLKEESGKLKNKEWSMDQNAFVSSAIPLLIEGELESTLPFLKVNDIDLGYSYDPRLQSAFRIWDDAASGGYYHLIPYHTMPHFWTAEVGCPLLLLYEMTKEEKYLITAYNAILTIYEFYNYDYQWNKWGKLKEGQAHVNYLPSLDMATQERNCVDQDAGFISYLETFGKKCYVAKSKKFINCQSREDKIISWAVYPRKYIFDDEDVTISADPFSVVINRVERKGGFYRLKIENLSKMSATTIVRLKHKHGEKKERIRLKGKGNLILNFILGG